MTYVDPIAWPCPECGVAADQLCRSTVWRDKREMTEMVHAARIDTKHGES